MQRNKFYLGQKVNIKDDIDKNQHPYFYSPMAKIPADKRIIDGIVLNKGVICYVLKDHGYLYRESWLEAKEEQ